MKLRSCKWLFFFITAGCFYGHAEAQNAVTLMPDGTMEASAGGMLVDIPSQLGGINRRLVLIPTVTGSWSNGIFAAPGMVGMHLSENPNLDFGPVLEIGAQLQRRDASGNSGSQLGVQAGVFANYNVAYNLTLTSDLLFGGDDDRRGARAQFGGLFFMPLAAHHKLSLGLGLAWANNSYMQSYFSISPQQAETDNLPTYQAKSGIENLYANGNWTWEINHKFTLDTGVRFIRLTGTADDSPLVIDRNGATVYSALNYGF